MLSILKNSIVFGFFVLIISSFTIEAQSSGIIVNTELGEQIGKITNINGNTVEMLTLKKNGIKANDIVFARNGNEQIKIKITYATHTSSSGVVIEGKPDGLIKGLYIYGQSRIELKRNDSDEKNNTDSFERVKKIENLLGNNGSDLEKNFDEIKKEALVLDNDERTYIFSQYSQIQKNNIGSAVALNMLFGLGLGSFSQGDQKGGLFSLIAEPFSLFLAISPLLIPTMQPENRALLSTLGISSYIISRIYTIIRPGIYASAYNKKLTEAIKLTVDFTPTFNLASNDQNFGAVFTAHF